MSHSNIYYQPNIMDSLLLKQVILDVKNIKWSRPPSGIPGNLPPRYVAALGDGSKIFTNKKKVIYIKPKNYPNITSYPIFQCAKNSSAHYKMNKIPKNLCKLIGILRNLVKDRYKNNAINVDNMFNVCVCNLYTDDSHQIADHRDDERWLEFNELDNNNIPYASIIASLTLYLHSNINSQLRRFQIYDDENKKWITKYLEHNSILLFSNHRHRAPVASKGQSSYRINITFRTLSPGILGLTGYGNFYRYMSIPFKIVCVNNNHLNHCKHFINSAIHANKFNNTNTFQENILFIMDKDDSRKEIKQKIIKENKIQLPKYVLPLCSVENCINFFTPNY